MVRSPYVADIRQSPFEASPFVSLLRTEGARMTAKEKKERKASIDALVADLKAEDECGGEMAHAPSLDCAGMLVMGSNAYVTRNSGATTKTAWTVQLCEEERGGKEPNVIVGYHPALAEKIAKSMLLHEDLPLRDELGEIEEIASQRTFKNSRVDFVIKGAVLAVVHIVEELRVGAAVIFLADVPLVVGIAAVAVVVAVVGEDGE